MGDIQCWLSLGSGGTKTQETTSSLSHFSSFCLFLLPLHWSIAPYHLVTDLLYPLYPLQFMFKDLIQRCP